MPNPLSLVALFFFVSGVTQAAEQRCFFGTYSRGDSVSQGIYTCLFDDETGRLTEPTLAATADNPSFLAVHPNQKWLYVCQETNDFEGEPSGAINAYEIDTATGTLTLINQRTSLGGAPCHCNVDATGKFLLAVNYLGGNAIVFPIGDDGALSEHSCVLQHIGSGSNRERQQAPHAHSINLSADNRFAYVADLGIDRVMIYRFDSQRGLLVPTAADSVALPPGGGPRHFALHPSGLFAYSNNELTAEVTALRRDPQSGGLTAIQNTATIPSDFNGRKSTAECLVHPNGKFVYVSNRGHDSIAVYRVEEETGQLTLVEITSTEGREPRNFVIHASGQWLIALNQNSDSVVVFQLNSNTGKLSATSARITVGKPVCLRMMEQ